MYRWDGGSALVQTIDFFTPIVDDPYLYGQIAAANALSDVYAMGGRPLTALAIAGFTKDGPGRDVLQAIFRGGLEKLREADVALLGGHTVQDTEIKFGYAVTGAIDPDRVLMLDLDYTNNSRLLDPAAVMPAAKWASKWMIWLQDFLATFAFFV